MLPVSEMQFGSLGLSLTLEFLSFDSLGSLSKVLISDGIVTDLISFEGAATVFMWVGGMLVLYGFVVRTVANVCEGSFILMVEGLNVTDYHFGDDGVSHIFAMIAVVRLIPLVGGKGTIAFSFEGGIGDGSDSGYLIYYFLWFVLTIDHRWFYWDSMFLLPCMFFID